MLSSIQKNYIKACQTGVIEGNNDLFFYFDQKSVAARKHPVARNFSRRHTALKSSTNWRSNPAMLSLIDESINRSID